MEKIKFKTAAKNLKKNFMLLFSTVAALCLFLSPSLTSLLMVVSVFIAVSVLALLDYAKPAAIHNCYARIGSVLLTLLIAFMGYDTFNTTWTSSRKVGVLADALHLPKPILLMIVGLVGCVAGFYAMYTLSCWIVNIKDKLPEQRKSVIIANLKRNWYFPISAMAFFCLSATSAPGYFVGLLIAFVVSLIASSQISSIWDFTKKNRIGLHMVSVLTAIAICWFGQSSFYTICSISSKAQALKAMLPISVDIFGFVSVFGAVAALFFVYFWVLLFWREMTKSITETGVFNGIKTREIVVYIVLLLMSFAIIIFSFAQTEAFYGAEYEYDIIYTSDSGSLVKGNVYLDLTHPENDLRQPLFVVFAAPFFGIPYLIGKLLGASASVQAMLMNFVQIVMLITANFMLTKMMKLSPTKRICFMILTYCTYTHLLFTLMMEQYIVAYFWLIFCLYLICEKKQPDRIAMWGAGGTLLTSMILLPFMSEKSPFKNFKEWFVDMVKYGLEFFAVMLVFCRFDVIFSLVGKVSQLSHFTGRDLTMMDKIFQYIEFVRNCFAAPNAGVSFTAYDHVSWQLNTATGINFIGVVILLLVIASAGLNRDKKSSLFAAGWVGFSVIMLFGLGWGTTENGLILYALYFGWAFIVLLFQLVEKIENKLNVKWLLPVLSMGCAVALAVVNIPAILEMVNFAITYYPA